MFIDQATIHVKAGDGGSGRVSFRREKFVPKGGPDGGNGGNGGNIILVANPQLHTLLDHRYRKQYRAKSGEPGSSARKNGKTGEDLSIEVPCGTLVKNVETDEILVDLIHPHQEFIVAYGGKGGRGNAEFATAVRQTPRFAEPGTKGNEKDIILELKLIAEVGLIGAPNAGKSTLISTISAARPKIAEYPFTTLEPILGIVRYSEYQSFTVADIPGIIEGAHRGKGLGIKFLQHIERTKVLVVLIDCTCENYEAEYKSLMNELFSYSPHVRNKPHVIAFSKIDVANDEIKRKMKSFKSGSEVTVLTISSVAGTGIRALLNTLWKLLREHSNG